MGSIANDVKFVVRTLRRRPAFAFVAVATLGIGIGTTAAMFGVVDNVVYRSVPFARPDRLVNVWLTSEEAQGAPGLIGESWNRIPISSTEYRAWRGAHPSFRAVAVHGAAEGVLSGADHADLVSVGYASASLLHVLGVDPERGRWFSQAEEGTEATDPARVMVVSHETWQGRLGGDPDVLGRDLVLDGVSRTVVGVLPKDFRLRYLGMHLEGEDRQGARDVWVPLGGTTVPWSGNNLEAMGRLSDHATLAGAEADAGRVLLAGHGPGDRDRGPSPPSQPIQSPAKPRELQEQRACLLGRDVAPSLGHLKRRPRFIQFTERASKAQARIAPTPPKPLRDIERNAG